MKSFSEIEKTGEWWLQEGWHKYDGIANRKYSPEALNTAIETLKPLFTADWFRDSLKTQDRQLITSQLIHVGPISNDFIIELSRMINSLKHVAGFSSIIERLKGKESF